MAFERPTLQELVTRVEADLISRLEVTGAVLRRALLRVLARVWAGATHGVHGHVEWASKQVFALTADAEQLDTFGAELGLSRKPAAFAIGVVNFTGVNGTIIAAGTRLARHDGVEYSTLADVIVAAGAAAADVQAIAAGIIGNASAATLLSLVSPIAGIQSAATVAAGGLTGGIDVETDADYRERILQRKRRPPQGGSVSDYENWTLEVPGVTRAFVLPAFMGLGTVGVTFVLDNEVNIIPGAPKVQEVLDYLSDPARKPVTAQLFVVAPIAVPLNINITLTPNTQAVRDAVTAELKDFFRRDASPGATLRVSRIREAISVAAGEENHVLTAPAADVVHAPTQIGTLGVVTFA